MKKRLVLIGTRHTYQYGAGNAWNSEAPCSPEDEQAFRQRLIDVAAEQHVPCIAEEMNEDGLAEAKKSESVPQSIAGILGLPHVFCVLNRKERVALGIKQENEIRIGLHDARCGRSLPSRLSRTRAPLIDGLSRGGWTTIGGISPGRDVRRLSKARKGGA